MSKCVLGAAVAVALGAASVATTGSSFAATGGGGACDQSFGMIDVDNDGRVSDSEASSWRQKMFEHLDDDKDGKVTRREFAECHAGSPAASTFRTPDRHLRYRDDARYEELDANKDQKVTYEEYVGAGHSAFRSTTAGGPTVTVGRYDNAMRGLSNNSGSADLNGDGIISEDEAAAEVDRSFWGLDDDKDWVLTKDEWKGDRRMAFADARFKLIDVDNDGTVDLDEWFAADKRRAKAVTGDNTPGQPVWGYRGGYLLGR